MNIDQFITKTKEYLTIKQQQTLQSIKLQVYVIYKNIFF